LKLAAAESKDWQNRKHFFRVASRAMRQVVVDHVRRHLAEKRGGEFSPLPIDEAILASRGTPSDILAVDEALDRLKEIDHRVYQVVELRFFGGLSVEETAEVLDIAPRTVKREWRAGRAWLRGALEAGGIGRATAAGEAD
ncbi:MAG: RNA polymerase subunit sigma-70, partial [bacterium]|nr:RNA polymerase subunit sigma-70 [bacterium]